MNNNFFLQTSSMYRSSGPQPEVSPTQTCKFNSSSIIAFCLHNGTVLHHFCGQEKIVGLCVCASVCSHLCVTSWIFFYKV